MGRKESNQTNKNLCFGWEIRKIIFRDAHLSGGLNMDLDSPVVAPIFFTM